MANLHETFLAFNDKIKLHSSKKEQLRISRDAVRDDIEKYFEKKISNHTVKFKGQGSFAMNTTILPISGEYDVDDGVYIFGTEADRPTPKAVHDWIYKAVENRTNQKTINKHTCIRVQYADIYHIDLPIYYKVKDSSKENFYDSEDIPELAHTINGWIYSDPYAFKKWFDKQANEKIGLKRLVRYFKAWIDNKNNVKFPSGMIFTILASNNYVESERDDEALLLTLKKIQESIDDTRFDNARYICQRPTIDKTENLLDKYSADTTKNNFLNALDSFIKSGCQAIEHKSKIEACAKWQKHLGNRFPCSLIQENDEDIAKVFSIPDIIKTDNKSA